MTETTVLARPVSIMTEMDILESAATLLEEHELLRVALRDAEAALRVLCRQYDKAAGTTGFQPYHLRHACVARGLL